MTILLICNLVAGVALGIFQLMILAECGVVQRRLGDRIDAGAIAKFDEKVLIGKSSLLPPLTKALFVSFSCSSCAKFLRELKGDSGIEVYVADQDDAGQVAAVQSLYPAFNFRAHPGERIFKHLKIDFLPILLETDGNKVVIAAKKLN